MRPIRDLFVVAHIQIEASKFRVLFWVGNITLGVVFVVNCTHPNLALTRFIPKIMFEVVTVI